jgi:hypothetical protein
MDIMDNPREMDIMDNPLASAALSASKEGGTGHWDDIEGQQSRLKDPGYCKRKVEAYDKRLRAQGAEKGDKSFNNGFEKIITSTSERKLYMGLEWSSDVYTTQNQLNLLGTATEKFREWKRDAKALKATSDALFLVIALCGALVPPIIGVSTLFPSMKWLKTACDLSAIVMSIVGTVCSMVVQQYQYAARAAITEAARIDIEALCEQFCNLNGPVFDPSNANLSDYWENQSKGAPSKGYSVPSFDGVPDEVLKLAVDTHLKAKAEGRAAAPVPRHHANFKLFALEYRRLVTDKQAAIAKVLGS